MNAQIKVTVENDKGLTKKQVADVVVEEELNKFNEFLTSTFGGTQPMASFERAIVKTYIMHKLEDQISKMPG